MLPGLSARTKNSLGAFSVYWVQWQTLKLQVISPSPQPAEQTTIISVWGKAINDEGAR